MKTFSAKKEDIQRSWYVVDAAGKTLGRLASKVAHRLRGKHKPIFTPHVDTGDYIVILNAEKVNLTGNKVNNKMYYHHTGFPGGIKSTNFDKLNKQHPARPLEAAIRGMLPKGPLGREMFKKLKVYSGTEHPHTAQQPEILEV